VEPLTTVNGEQPEVDELLETSEEGGGEGGEEPAPTSISEALKVSAVRSTIAGLRRKGFRRIVLDGQAVPFDDLDPATLTGHAFLQVVVDRLKLDFDTHVLVHAPNPDKPQTKADLMALAKTVPAAP
jgi:hypothetical protein